MHQGGAGEVADGDESTADVLGSGVSAQDSLAVVAQEEVSGGNSQDSFAGSEFCTPSNEDRSSGKGRPMTNADFERRVKARIEEVAALRFGPPSSIDGDRPQYTESQIRYQAMPTGGRRDSSGWRAETDTRAAAAAGVRDYEELCRALAGDRDGDEDQLCGGGCSGGGGNGDASKMPPRASM